MSQHHEAPGDHEHPEHDEPSRACRVCSESYDPKTNPSFLGICETCGYKILIVLLIIMISTSYIAWFGVL